MIELENLGHKVELKKNIEPLPIELQDKLRIDKKFNKAFNSLTPGKQRAYILYFSKPKQAANRTKRIEAKEQNILNGISLHDNYKC